MAKEELEKLKEESQANKDHMLQVLILHYEIHTILCSGIIQMTFLFHFAV